jgi:hypothetical protein
MKPYPLLAALALAACGQAEQSAPTRAEAAPAIAMVADPCGGPRGEAERSDAWVNAELVKRGHAVEVVCRTPDQPLPDPAAAGGGLDDLEKRMAAMDTVAAMLKDRSELMTVTIQRQAEAIAAAEG